MAAILSDVFASLQPASSSQGSAFYIHRRKSCMTPNQLLLSYALRYPGWIVFTILLGFSSALFNGVSSTLIVPLVLELLGQESINLSGGPPIIQKVLSFLGSGEGGDRSWVMLLVVILAIALKNVASYLNSIVSSSLSRKLVNTLRKEGISLLLDVDLDYYARIKPGDIGSQLGGEINRTAIAIRTAIQVITTSITILIFICILLAISWQLTLAATGLLLIVAVLNQYFVKRAKEFGKILTEKGKAYSTALQEILTGIRLIKAVSNEEAEYQRIEQIIENREKADYQSQTTFAIIGPVNEVSGILALLTIVLLGRTFFLEQIQSLSTILLIYLVVLFRLLPFVSQLNAQRIGFANTASSTETVTDFLRRDNKPFMANGHKIHTKLEQGIRFEGVVFAYPDYDNLVLKGVNLWIPTGTTLALVGLSGAGKSTLVDLVPRFYDPIEGCITLDGIDLREFDLRSLRRAMGIVSQDTFLFNQSVRYNIAYGRENATEDEIIEAAKRANAYEFIVELPQGFDTEVGNRGSLLSGGQRQRLTIARALLRNPDVLILDEATSALDTVTEHLVRQAIEELCRDRTTIVIAHRLSTVQKADQIAVLDKGQVLEIGTHKELLHKGGYYSRVYSMQFEQDDDKLIGI
jgi:subfamily B ATP-binding cassette protein MsbA